jgi:hypothetical protein
MAGIYVAVDGLGADLVVLGLAAAGLVLRPVVAAGGGLPVVHELQSDVELLALEQALDFL